MWISDTDRKRRAQELRNMPPEARAVYEAHSIGLRGEIAFDYAYHWHMAKHAPKRKQAQHKRACDDIHRRFGEVPF